MTRPTGSNRSRLTRLGKFSLTPVERAVAKQKWASTTLNAHLQALMGDNYHKVVDAVATLTFIIGVAADIDRIPRDNPDLRMVEGAARTTLDVAVAESITPLQRGAMEAGLLAIERLKPRLTDHALMEASVQLTVLMRVKGGVYWGDFENVFGKR